MSTESSSQSKEFAQVVNDATAAIEALVQSIDQENKSFLAFCDSLINDTLQAMTSLSKMELDKTKAGVEEQLKSAMSQASKAAEEKRQAIAAATHKDNPTQASEMDPDNLEQAFVNSMNAVMLNAVTRQQNLLVMTQAATTQTISTILTLTPVVLAEAVEGIEEK